MHTKHPRQNGWLFALLFLFILGLVFLVAKMAYPSRPITIILHTNGVASVYGIPLQNKILRRSLFTAIKILKPKRAEVSLSIPSGVPAQVAITNLLFLSSELKQAGLTSPPKPNPYE